MEADFPIKVDTGTNVVMFVHLELSSGSTMLSKYSCTVHDPSSGFSLRTAAILGICDAVSMGFMRVSEILYGRVH